MGYRDASGWHMVVKSNKPVQLKPGTAYDMLVAVNGTNVTVSVAGVNWFTYTFAPRLEDGEPQPLSRGLVGFGLDGSKGTVDNFTVQVLPPDWTLNVTDGQDSSTGLLDGGATTGTWTEAGGLTTVSAPANTNALRLANLGTEIAVDSIIELEAKLKITSASGLAGIAFDVYSDTDFKFVAVDEAGDRILVGHHSSRDGWVIDRSFARTIAAGADVTLKLVSNGASLSVYANGSLVGSHAFNAALVDGNFGLMARGASAQFDSFTLRANDRALAGYTLPQASTVQLLQADSVGQGAHGPALTAEQAQSLFDAAVRRLDLGDDPALLAALSRVHLRIEDLGGAAIASWQDDGVITLDIDAAGHGWFVDLTPDVDEEFDPSGFALPGLAAQRMDLLSALVHELGHASGLHHGDTPWMADTLATGQRSAPAYGLPLSPVVPSVPPHGLWPYGLPLMAAPEATAATARAPAPSIDWTLGGASGAALATAPAGKGNWVRDFTQHLGQGEAQRNPNASLRVQLPVSASAAPKATLR